MSDYTVAIFVGNSEYDDAPLASIGFDAFETTAEIASKIQKLIDDSVKEVERKRG